MRPNSLDQYFNSYLISFPHRPTPGQRTAIQLIFQYLLNPSPNNILLLKGFAGTGKTTLIAHLVTQLQALKHKIVLLAPTGRAAKVMSQYAQYPASTIHRKIYFPKSSRNGSIRFVLQANKHKNTLFIVDESSMISHETADAELFSSISVLNDLLDYINDGVECKLILVGDTAQLPPVGSLLSPALDVQVLRDEKNLEVIEIEMEEVVRQAAESGILSLATLLRTKLESGRSWNFSSVSPDVRFLAGGTELLEALEEAFSSREEAQSAVVVHSNKRANLYNSQIRARILHREEELEVGDLLMVVRNNYFWLPLNSEAGFIANGDMVQVRRIYGIEDRYGFRFAQVQLGLIDYPTMDPVDVTLNLSTLTLHTSSLGYESYQKLVSSITENLPINVPKYKRLNDLKSNPYLNALQVKYAYAITCHKAQGGQWNTIFVEAPFAPNMGDEEYMRWLYTAVTRAQKMLFLIGFQRQ